MIYHALAMSNDITNTVGFGSIPAAEHARPSRPVQHSAALSGMVAVRGFAVFLHSPCECV